jgi:phosphoribosylanthranilate isomerase
VTKVKICGISRSEDGLVALEAGADLLGFVFYPPSHRYLVPSQARQIVARCRERFPSGWQAVGVFVNVPIDELNATVELANLDLVQLAGDESPAYCAAVNRPVVKVVRVDTRSRPTGPTDAAAWNAERILLDSHRPGRYGGTGQAYDWASVWPHAGRALLAGGLSPTNVGQAIRLARPWGLDASSGVERKRRKDPRLIRQFLAEVRAHDGAR